MRIVCPTAMRGIQKDYYHQENDSRDTVVYWAMTSLATSTDRDAALKQDHKSV